MTKEEKAVELRKVLESSSAATKALIDYLYNFDDSDVEDKDLKDDIDRVYHEATNLHNAITIAQNHIAEEELKSLDRQVEVHEKKLNENITRLDSLLKNELEALNKEELKEVFELSREKDNLVEIIKDKKDRAESLLLSISMPDYNPTRKYSAAL